ncbi:Serine-threonine protein kinase 19 [Abeliophyllum distichum]|uniref:Serine-threonine protein kinase 19 n=1 Tax=Abeliophyllum distichum TaxID=126358 RepID=A0ABD1NUE2_9LAMI
MSLVVYYNVDNIPEGSLSLEENFSFSDTVVALQIMRAQFPHIEKLYSNIKDRTQVDRELESLRRDRVLRTFKLNTGQDDHVVMFMDDYLNQIEHVVKRMEVKIQDDLMFAIPNIGSVLKGLSQGRREVLSFLNRRKYKEMMLAPLEKNFHVTDQDGNKVFQDNIVERIQQSLGPRDAASRPWQDP